MEINNPNGFKPEFLSIQDLMQLFNAGKTKAYSIVKTPNFPRPVFQEKRFIRWKRSDVEAWINQQQPKGN